MEHTLNRKSKLSTLSTNSDNYAVSGNSSTPVQSKVTTSYDECSPIFVPCTQEAYDELDVVWDWNSPQSKPKQKKLKQKRLQTHSPKAAVKKYSHNQPVVNEKIKNQLEKLKTQLQTELRPSSHKLKSAEIDVPGAEDLKDLAYVFDDSFEKELILQSQQADLITSKLKEGAFDTKETRTTEFRKVKSDDCLNESSVRNTFRMKSTSSGDLYISPRQKTTVSVKLENRFQSSFDDSFDLALQSSEGTKFNRVDNSMSMSFVENISMFDMQEIERKRQEAIAKLRSKKLQNVISPIEQNRDVIETVTTKVAKVEDSPIKCSPEEIEQKRLQALAKLEAKKKQEVIEHNRREALKRLQMNKKKRELLLKNTKS